MGSKRIKIEKILDSLDRKAITTAGLELPINVDVSKKEKIYAFGWQNLSPKQIRQLRELIGSFAFSNDNIKNIKMAFKSLDEKAFNTHIGFAQLGHTGHSNASVLFEAITNQKPIIDAALNENISDAHFGAFFFDGIAAQLGIGPDTITDFIIFVNLDNFKEYTSKVWQAQSEEFKQKYPLNKNSTIRIEDKDINLLLVPEVYEREGGYSLYKNGTPLSIIFVESKFRAIINESKSFIHNKDKTSAQRTLSKVRNTIIKLIQDESIYDVAKLSLLIQNIGPAANEIIQKTGIILELPLYIQTYK